MGLNQRRSRNDRAGDAGNGDPAADDRLATMEGREVKNTDETLRKLWNKAINEPTPESLRELLDKLK